MNVEPDHLSKTSFVILSIDKYHKFLRLQKDNEELRSKLEHHLKYRPIVSPSPSTTSASTTLKTGEGHQTEEKTLSSTLSQPELVKTIVSQVLQILKPPTSSSSHSSEIKQGAGDDAGLLTELPDGLPATLSPNIQANEALIDNKDESLQDSSDLNDFNSTDQKLLDTISPFRQPKAKKLLLDIKPYYETIHFKENGTIYIDGKPLENSNIFKLFPFLFKPANYSNHIYLREIVSEIASLGLGHLISRFYTSGLSPRGKNFIQDRHEVHKQIKSKGSNWYKISYD